MPLDRLRTFGHARRQMPDVRCPTSDARRSMSTVFPGPAQVQHMPREMGIKPWTTIKTVVENSCLFAA